MTDTRPTAEQVIDRLEEALKDAQGHLRTIYTNHGMSSRIVADLMKPYRAALDLARQWRENHP